MDKAEEARNILSRVGIPKVHPKKLVNIYASKTDLWFLGR